MKAFYIISVEQVKCARENSGPMEQKSEVFNLCSILLSLKGLDAPVLRCPLQAHLQGSRLYVLLRPKMSRSGGESSFQSLSVFFFFKSLQLLTLLRITHSMTHSVECEI